MPRNIDSDALLFVQRQLGLSGVGESKTELLSDDLPQVFAVNDAIRRGRADILTGGWFFGLMETTHATGDAEVTNIDPYRAGAAAVGSFPPVVDPRFDVWIEGAMVRRTSGSANTTNVALTLLLPSRFMAFGIDDADAPVAATAVDFILASWNGVFDTGQAIFSAAPESASGMNRTFAPLGFRMPRGGAFLQMEVDANAASEWQMYIMMGLFPVGMGSDVGRW